MNAFVTNTGLEHRHNVLIALMVTTDLLAALHVQEAQQNHVLDLVNVRKGQRELENVPVKAESLEALVTCVQQIILVRIVNRLVLLEVQVLFVLDMEHVMQEHQCRQEIALVLKGGREIIGKFVYLFLFIFHFSICY